MDKITWKVSSVPTGRYRSFDRRRWPQAWINDRLICAIECQGDDYCPQQVKTGSHAPLWLRVFDYSKGEQQRSSRKSIRSYATLAEAKAALPKILELHPEFLPSPREAQV